MALSRQLIAFLPVLPAALPVALARDHVRACAFAPDLARCQAQIDDRKHVLHAVRMVLDPARV